MEMGEIEARILKEAERTGRVPQRILEAPELLPGLELYWNAFQELTTCRPFGMSKGLIPWLAIDQYCRRLELSNDLSESMFYHIRAMDFAYLEQDAKTSKNS